MKLPDIAIHLSLGFTLGFTGAGTMAHFVITPKPVAKMLKVARRAPGIESIVGDATKLDFQRDYFWLAKWDGEINNRTANISCEILSEKGNALLTGRLVQVTRNHWEPIFVCLTKDSKDTILRFQ